jgi:hypothetical protein
MKRKKKTRLGLTSRRTLQQHTVNTSIYRDNQHLPTRTIQKLPPMQKLRMRCLRLPYDLWLTWQQQQHHIAAWWLLLRRQMIAWPSNWRTAHPRVWKSVHCSRRNTKGAYISPLLWIIFVGPMDTRLPRSTTIRVAITPRMVTSVRPPRTICILHA